MLACCFSPSPFIMPDTGPVRPTLLSDAKQLHINLQSSQSAIALSAPAASAESLDVDSGRSSSGGSSRLASPDTERTIFQSLEAGFRVPSSKRSADGWGLSRLAANVKTVGGGGGCCPFSANGPICRLAAKVAAVVVAVSLYNAYLVYAIHYHVSLGKELAWCDGLGFLIVLTLLVYLNLFYFHVVKRCVRRHKLRLQLPGRLQQLLATRLASHLATLLVIVAVVVFLVLDSSRDRYRCVCVHAVLTLIFKKWYSGIIWPR